MSDESKYFKVGDYVDIKDYHYGAWFMAKLIKIKKDKSSGDKPNDPKSPVQNDGLIYVVEILGYVFGLVCIICKCFFSLIIYFVQIS